MHFCAENVFLAGYEHSDDEDQDDQPGDSGPHKPLPGVPHVVRTTSCFCAQPQVPAGLQFDFYYLAAMHRPCFALFMKLINDYQEDPLLPTLNVQEKVSGRHILHIEHILHFMSYLTYFNILMLQKIHRLEFLKQRAEEFSQSLCETVVFIASETVSIG